MNEGTIGDNGISAQVLNDIDKILKDSEIKNATL